MLRRRGEEYPLDDRRDQREDQRAEQPDHPVPNALYISPYFRPELIHALIELREALIDLLKALLNQFETLID